MVVSGIAGFTRRSGCRKRIKGLWLALARLDAGTVWVWEEFSEPSLVFKIPSQCDAAEENLLPGFESLGVC